MAVHEGDAERVLEVAGALTGTPALPFADVLDRLLAVIPSRIASFNDMALVANDFRVVARPRWAEPKVDAMRPVFDRYGHQHPVADHLAALGAAGALEIGAVRLSDLPGSGDAFMASELYQRFFRPLDVRHQLLLTLASPPDVVVGYALSRSERDGDFAERDVEVMNALAPYLSLHHRSVRDAERSALVDVEAAADGWTVVSARVDGVIDATSAPVGAPWQRPGSLLPDAVVELCRQGGTAQPAVVTIDGRTWRCAVRPSVSGPFVISLRPTDDVAPGVAALIDVGLTPRQSEVAIALADTGGTNAQLAAALGVSVGTVRKHLEAVFVVLGVSGRAAAVVAVNRLLER